MKPVLRAAARTVLVLAAVVVAYVLAALVGSAIPVNGSWKQAEAGVRIQVVDNGVHTDLVLPLVAEGVDWRALLRPEDLANPRMAGHSHVMFGWGDRDFYLNTPTWLDVNPLRVAKAMAGMGRTVVHVAHVPEPGPDPHIRTIMLRPDEYRRLAAGIRATFATGADGRAPSVRGYAGHDAFYEAKGGYSALRTCNQWTGAMLRGAGVRMGAWTPFPWGVMQWL